MKHKSQTCASGFYISEKIIFTKQEIFQNAFSFFRRQKISHFIFLYHQKRENPKFRSSGTSLFSFFGGKNGFFKKLPAKNKNEWRLFYSIRGVLLKNCKSLFFKRWFFRRIFRVFWRKVFSLRRKVFSFRRKVFPFRRKVLSLWNMLRYFGRTTGSSEICTFPSEICQGSS